MFDKLTIQNLKQIIDDIDYNKIYLEIGWQIELIIKLRQKLGNDYDIIPEALEKTSVKKELDVSVMKSNKRKYAIELKLPQHNAFNRRWPQAIRDITFLEELISAHEYERGFFVFLTPIKRYWKEKEISSYSINWIDVKNSNKELKYFIIEVVKHRNHQKTL